MARPPMMSAASAAPIRNPTSRASVSAVPFSAVFSMNRSTSCVVSGYPCKNAPVLPRTTYSTSCLASASRSRSSSLSLIAFIAEPSLQVLVAPSSVVCGGVERTVRRVVEHRLVRSEERVVHLSLEWPAPCRLEVEQMFGLDPHRCRPGGRPLPPRRSACPSLSPSPPPSAASSLGPPGVGFRRSASGDRSTRLSESPETGVGGEWP